MTTTAIPVRRSALERVHHAIGKGASTWPLSYGDPDGERRTVESGIGLAEPGLSDKWIVRGAGTLAACASAGIQARAGFLAPAPAGGINAWAIADDEAWLTVVAPLHGGPSLTVTDAAPVVASLRGAGLYVTDVGSGWTVLRLVGPRLRDLLEELVAEDVSDAALPDLAIRQVPMAACRVILARRDHAGQPGCSILVARDEAEHLWESLLHSGEPYGIRPVGVAAVLPAPTEARR